jgi:hypothetical protein
VWLAGASRMATVGAKVSLTEDHRSHPVDGGLGLYQVWPPTLCPKSQSVREGDEV